MTKRIFITLTLLLIFSFTTETIQKISVEMEVKNVHNGKLIATKGILYYNLSLERAVTRLLSPVEIISIHEKNGETTNYDPKNNMVKYTKSDLSVNNENIFKYYLQSNNNDLGLKEKGFILKESKIDKNLLIKTWLPPAALTNVLSKTELVLQNNVPIYIANFDKKNRITNKTYFTKFITLSNFKVPCQISDFQYMYLSKNLKDSVVSKSNYSNFKTNNDVDLKYLNFNVPSNAKIIFD